MRPRTAPTAVGFVALLLATNAVTEEVLADQGPPGGKPPEVEKSEPAAAAQPKNTEGSATTRAASPHLFCKCAMPALPLFVEDWGRLAHVTQPDRVVFEKADFWRDRQASSRWLLAGAILGGGAAGLATVDRLGNGTWTDTNKWGLAGGVALAAVSALAYLAFSPDRDDRLTVINQWNLRHPDRPLAP